MAVVELEGAVAVNIPNQAFFVVNDVRAFLLNTYFINICCIKNLQYDTSSQLNIIAVSLVY